MRQGMDAGLDKFRSRLQAFVDAYVPTVQYGLLPYFTDINGM